ncbi:hypothetical protein ASE14_05360 [Agromyces sp. Root81]|nr:hypothetical protein ASE14_05360 [Agromyces sp. Root81]
MSAAGVGIDSPLATREQVCRACVKRRDFITERMQIPAIVLDEWVTDADRDYVESVVASLRPDTWTEFELDGVPLGRYAAYELWLNLKLVSTDLTPAVWAHYVGQLRNTLYAYLGGAKILDAERPDAIIVYNDHYSVNHAFSAAARARGIRSYTIHGGHHIVRRAETLSILASGHTMEDVFRSEAWNEYSRAPIGKSEIDLVASHFDGLLEGSSAFAYSSAFEGTGSRELRHRLGIADGARVLLAAMSSEDELMGVRLIDAIPTNLTQTSLFADQFEWVDFLFEYARRHPDVHLLLRLHPRMFPNKRENVLSPVASQIMARRDDAPKNITFNMPSDGLALYDIMQIVDVLLNFRSTVGAELSSFGIPVVVPSNADFYTYPSTLNRVGHTTEEYGAQIDAALREGWSLENARRAYRWYAFLFSRFAVDFSDAVSSRPIAVRPKKPGLRLRLWNKFVFLVLQHGPLVRERLAIRNRGLSESSQEVLLDVVKGGLDAAPDSKLWPPIDVTLEEESALLRERLLGFAEARWSAEADPDSLAGRIRSHLAADASVGGR